MGSVATKLVPCPGAQSTGPEGPWAAAEQARGGEGRGGVGGGTGTVPFPSRPARLGEIRSPSFASVGSA